MRSKNDSRGYPTFSESQRRSGALLFETSVCATEVYDGAAELGSISTLYGEPSKRWEPRASSPVRYSLGFKSKTPRPWDAPASARRAPTPGPGHYNARSGDAFLTSTSTSWSVRGRGNGGIATPFDGRLSASFRSVTPRSGQHFSTKPPNKVGDLDRFVLPSDASRSAAARRDWVRAARPAASPPPPPLAPTWRTRRPSAPPTNLPPPARPQSSSMRRSAQMHFARPPTALPSVGERRNSLF